MFMYDILHILVFFKYIYIYIIYIYTDERRTTTLQDTWCNIEILYLL